MRHLVRSAWILLACAGPAFAQTDAIPPAEKLVTVAASPVTIAAGGRGTATLSITIADTWHINANPPRPDYMIGTTVTVKGARGVTPGATVYPPGRDLKLGFDENPISVYDHAVQIQVPIAVAKDAIDGKRTLKGTVEFQSCNDKVCLAPAEVPFEVAVTVTGGVAGTLPAEPPTREDETSLTRGPPASDSVGAATTGDATPPAVGKGFMTSPDQAAVVRNPITEALAKGGWAAFLTLFLIGLALNLTPCVYPMLGVTVSIFGARSAAPPLQVFGLATLYVLGMATMYSVLGLVAAFTGGLFGAALQSPIVGIVIGLLLIGLSLSMFGLYEFQLPPALMARLGGSGATSAAGVFLSGLLVGVFAAPCTGPPIVALLAVVGEKGDPWFGFLSFFTLSLGLGVPYLLLGTFSNLLQRMPKSGDWMVWVKKLFGVIMFSIGLFYMLLVLAPRWSGWVVPVALITGGIYLGFFEKSAKKKPRFRKVKWATGALAILGGIAIVATTPTGGIEFRELDEAHLKATLASGKPVLVDFSADWCLPCHELERSTFTDRRVIDRVARGFGAYKVNLTKWGSPEVERWRKQYRIRGVPTVVFLAPSGDEVREARVEEFLTPLEFLQRMDAAERATHQAAGR